MGFTSPEVAVCLGLFLFERANTNDPAPFSGWVFCCDVAGPLTDSVVTNQAQMRRPDFESPGTLDSLPTSPVSDLFHRAK